MLLRTHRHHPLRRLTMVIVIEDSNLFSLVDGTIVSPALTQDAASIAAVVIVVVVSWSLSRSFLGVYLMTA